MTQGTTHPNPVWRNCPPLCDLTNLPAFETWKDADAFNKRDGDPSILLKWQCSYCHGWHYWIKPRSPAGDSSGSGRPYFPPEPIVHFTVEATL
jgi:hypothetical protein